MKATKFVDVSSVLVLAPDVLKGVVRDILVSDIKDTDRQELFLAAVARALSKQSISLVSLLAITGTIVRNSLNDVTPTEFAQVVRYLKIQSNPALVDVLALFEAHYREELHEYMLNQSNRAHKRR